MTPRCKSLTASLCALVLAACAGPGERFRQAAADAGWETCTLRAAGLPLRTAHSLPGASERLHVYIEGDGVPWRGRRQVAADPTPRHPLMLSLMALDPQPSLYLGRPCYHGLSEQPACSAEVWTFARYGPAVLDAMAAALADFIRAHAIRHLDLFGHSGGGALAMLLAERFAPQTVSVVTLAGNLDTRAWSALHGFTPLAGSLNPAERPALPAAIRQFHLVGGKDTNVPPALVRAALARQTEARVMEWGDFDHACCWKRVWADILNEVNSAPPTTYSAPPQPAGDTEWHCGTAAVY